MRNEKEVTVIRFCSQGIRRREEAVAAMATMKEMAAEYRVSAAKLAMRIAEKKAAGASYAELLPLQEALRDIREAQRLMDGYYDVPRPYRVSAVGWGGRRCKDDH